MIRVQLPRHKLENLMKNILNEFQRPFQLSVDLGDG